MNTSVVDEARSVAEAIKNSLFIPPEIRGDVESLTHIIITGMELGLPPTQALRAFWISRGPDGPKLAMTADAMLALLYRQGVKVTFEEVSDEAVTISAVRPDGQAYRVRFTIEDARRAGLLTSREGKPRESWQRYPRRMLRARAVGMVFRDVGPDYGGVGIWTPEELEELSDAAPRGPETKPAEYVVGIKQQSKPAAEAQPERQAKSEAEPKARPELEPEAEPQPEASTEHEPPDADLVEHELTKIKETAIMLAVRQGLSRQQATRWIATVAKAMAPPDSTDQKAWLRIADLIAEFLLTESPATVPASQAASQIRAAMKRAERACSEIGLGATYADWLRLLRYRFGMTWENLAASIASEVRDFDPVALGYWIRRAASEQPADIWTSLIRFIDGVRGGDPWETAWEQSLTSTQTATSTDSTDNQSLP